MGVQAAGVLRRCPRTTALLDGIPGLFEAFFSILEGGKSIPRTRGRTGAISAITSAWSCPRRTRRRSGSRTRSTPGRRARASCSTIAGTTRSTTSARRPRGADRPHSPADATAVRRRQPARAEHHEAGLTTAHSSAARRHDAAKVTSGPRGLGRRTWRGRRCLTGESVGSFTTNQSAVTNLVARPGVSDPRPGSHGWWDRVPDGPAPSHESVAISNHSVRGEPPHLEEPSGV